MQQRRSWRGIGRWALLVGGVLLVAVVMGRLVREQLRFCAPLDRALQRSGCLQVFEIKELVGASLVAVSPVSDRAIVTGIRADPANAVGEAVVVELAGGTVIARYAPGDFPGDSPQLYFGADGMTVTRDEQTRKRIWRVTSPDGQLRVEMLRPDHRLNIPDYRLSIQATASGATLREIPVTVSVRRIPHLALSHDNRRLAAVFLSDGRDNPYRLVVWDLERGEQIFNRLDPAIVDADWLGDNRTLAVTLLLGPDRPTTRLALVRVPD